MKKILCLVLVTGLSLTLALGTVNVAQACEGKVAHKECSHNKKAEKKECSAEKKAECEAATKKECKPDKNSEECKADKKNKKKNKKKSR